MDLEESPKSNDEQHMGSGAEAVVRSSVAWVKAKAVASRVDQTQRIGRVIVRGEQRPHGSTADTSKAATPVRCTPSQVGSEMESAAEVLDRGAAACGRPRQQGLT